MFFDGLAEGWYSFKNTVKFSLRNPILLIPMLMAVGGIVYSVYYAVTYTAILEISFIYAILIYAVVVTFIVSVSSLILLELLEQKEKNQSMNFFIAFKDALIHDLWRALPLIVVWSILKFVLTLIEFAIMAAKAKAREKRKERGRTFRGYQERRLGRQQNFIEMIQTGVRLTSMTILASIAWEPGSPFKAMGKGFRAYKNHLGNFVSGVGFSMLLKLLMIIPTGLVLYFVSETGTEVSGGLMLGLLIYVGIIWAFSLMVEQVYVAELYLWYMSYEKESKIARDLGQDAPAHMGKAKKPSLFDNVADLEDENVRIGPERY